MGPYKTQLTSSKSRSHMNHILKALICFHHLQKEHWVTSSDAAVNRRRPRQWFPSPGNRSKQSFEYQCRKDTKCWETCGLKEFGGAVTAEVHPGCRGFMCTSKLIKITQANSCCLPHMSSVWSSALTCWVAWPHLPLEWHCCSLGPQW